MTVRVYVPPTDDLRGLWLSRLMFGWIADAHLGTSHYTEKRTYEEYLAAQEAALEETDGPSEQGDEPITVDDGPEHRDAVRHIAAEHGLPLPDWTPTVTEGGQT